MLVAEVELLVIDAESMTEDVVEEGCIAIASRVFVKSDRGKLGGGGDHSIENDERWGTSKVNKIGRNGKGEH